MSINFTSLTSQISTRSQAIDKTAVNALTSQILAENTQTKSVNLDTLDLTKFKRIDLGVDLYNSKTDSNLATQVAVRNSGLDVNLNQAFISNVQYLNSQAAQNAFQTVKNVDGKIVVPVTENTESGLREVFALPKSTDIVSTQDLNKDKRGSNPFSYQRPSQGKSNQDEKSLSIFA